MTSISRLKCLLLVAPCIFFNLFTNSSQAAPPAKSEKPDIIIIVADDLGWGDLACYGGSDLRTPSLDKLAAGGLRWENFYANCCVCSPTRASILTGSYPDRVGVPGVIRTHPENNWGKLANQTTVAELLVANGYQTSCVGKWHLGLDSGDHPLDRGFEHFYGFLGDMMDDYFTHLRHGNNYMRQDRMEIAPEGHATELFTSAAIASIDSMRSSDQPFFLYLAYNAPHTPIQPPEDALQKVLAREPQISENRAKLVALIEDMDRGIGKVLDAVAKTERETLILFVSDNGGQLNVGANNGPFRDGKQSNYEGGLRIPAIFSWPSEIPSGQTCQAIGVTMDLLPTICEIIEVPMPEKIDGQSLLPWMLDPKKPQDQREIYYVRREGGTRYAGLTIEALRQGDWKLVHNLPTAEFELFNLAQDPYEQVDLSQKNPAKFRQMLSDLQPHIQRGGQVPWQRQE